MRVADRRAGRSLSSSSGHVAGDRVGKWLSDKPNLLYESHNGRFGRPRENGSGGLSGSSAVEMVQLKIVTLFRTHKSRRRRWFVRQPRRTAGRHVLVGRPLLSLWESAERRLGFSR